MKKADVFVHDVYAGQLIKSNNGETYQFRYLEGYQGPPVSLTMPVIDRLFSYSRFPAFFEGLLPEGIMLDGLLRQLKIDRQDYFSQLLAIGEDTIGAVTVKPSKDE